MSKTQKMYDVNSAAIVSPKDWEAPFCLTKSMFLVSPLEYHTFYYTPDKIERFKLSQENVDLTDDILHSC